MDSRTICSSMELPVLKEFFHELDERRPDLVSAVTDLRIMEGGVAGTGLSFKSRTFNAKAISSHPTTFKPSHRTLRRRSVCSDEARIAVKFSGVFHPSDVVSMQTASLLPNMVCRQ
jgi:hypothetical protein